MDKYKNTDLVEMIGLGNNKRNSESGLTLIEALVATVIVGIGFVSVFQMVQYSVSSIGVSSDRSKANLLMTMVVEDFISEKNTLHDKTKRVNFKDQLFDDEHGFSSKPKFEITSCSDSGPSRKSPDDNALDNKIHKWKHRFSKKRLKCTDNSGGTTNDAKRLNVFTLCNNSVVSKSNLSKSNRPCKFNITKKYTGHLPNSKTVGIYLERYFGRLEVGITTGKTKTVRGNKEPVSKKKVLYFQID